MPHASLRLLLLQRLHQPAAAIAAAAALTTAPSACLPRAQGEGDRFLKRWGGDHAWYLQRAKSVRKEDDALHVECYPIKGDRGAATVRARRRLRPCRFPCPAVRRLPPPAHAHFPPFGVAQMMLTDKTYFVGGLADKHPPPTAWLLLEDLGTDFEASVDEDDSDEARPSNAPLPAAPAAILLSLPPSLCRRRRRRGRWTSRRTSRRLATRRTPRRCRSC